MSKSILVRVLLCAAVVGLALAIDPQNAAASPPFDLMGDVGSAGGLLQPKTVPGGSGAAYFNPSLLTEAPAGVTVGFVILNQRIGIALDGRPGTEFAIPDGLQNAGHADGKRFDNYAVPTNLLQFGRMKDSRNEAFRARPRQAAGTGHETMTYEVVGLVVKLFKERVALGFHMFVPNGQFTKLATIFADEREQYFSNSLHPELYSDRMTALSMGLGLGFKITDRFSIGAGATFSLAASVVAPAYVTDTGNLGNILIDINAGVNIGIAPHFGATYLVTDRLRLSASVHTPQKVELKSSFTFLLGNGIEQSSGLSFLLDYTPWQAALGATYDLVQSQHTTFALAATGQYAGWSGYIDRHGDTPTPSYAWKDTFSPTLGARLRLDQVSTSLDVSYVPTPIPLQTGRSNYVDNDRIATGVGAEYSFPALGTTLKIGANVQVHRLIPRYQRKLPTPTQADGKVVDPERVKDELPDDAQLSGNPIPAAQGLQTNNPGWPGFGSGGWVLGGSVYLTVPL